MSTKLYHIDWVSERHLRVTSVASDADALVAAWTLLQSAAIGGVHEVVLGYSAIVLACDPMHGDWAGVEQAILRTLEGQTCRSAREPRTVRIPVCYDRSLAPDLADVATLTGLPVEQVIRTHASTIYTVRFLGFSPGFGYLDGLPASLHVPRLSSPRVRVPAGSVAIAADQAGVYPAATPGGWRLIGRTPLKMFDASRQNPARLEPGDHVAIEPISLDEFDRLQQAEGGTG